MRSGQGTAAGLAVLKRPRTVYKTAGHGAIGACCTAARHGVPRIEHMSAPIAGPAAGLRPVLELVMRGHHPGVQGVDRHATARA